MKNPLISILMVFRNEENYILNSIESILNQDYNDFELILINDASTDDSLKIVQTFNDKRILIINNSKKNGKSFCLNQGLEICKGKYIAICDADDFYLKNRLTAPLAILENDKNISICGAQAQLSTGVNAWTNPTGISEINWHILFRNPIINSTVLIRKSFLVANNINYTLTFNRSEDYKLWADCVFAGAKIANSNESTIIYTIKIKKVDSQQIDEANFVRKQLWEKYTIDNQLMKSILDFSNFETLKKKDTIAFKSLIKNQIPKSKSIIKTINKLWVEDLVNDGKSIFYLLRVGQLSALFSKNHLLKQAFRNIF